MSIPRVIRHATRRLVRAPAFATAAVLTLALGLGATTAVFSLVNGVLLRPLPYDHAEQLVDLSHTLAVSGVSRVDQSDATYLFYRRENHVFTDIGAYQAKAVNLGPISGAADGAPGSAAGAGRTADAERTAAGRVTASVFPVLRVSPLRGRAFTESDDRPGAPPVVLIGERLWQRKYGGDPGIIGRRLEIDGVTREVVGIMPESFRFPATNTELWLPAGIDPAHTASASFDYHAVARLEPGVSLGAAAADLQRLLPRVPEGFPGRLTTSAIVQTHMHAVVRPLRDVVVGDIARALWVILGAVGFVLAVACANVANLFLVHAEGRQKELAVRRALGARRGAILMEFFGEGLVLAAVGGALGLALASVGVEALQSLGIGLDIPRIAEVQVDGAVLAFTALVTLLTAFAVSALPALRSDTLALSTMLAETGRQATAGHSRLEARNGLVVAQIALALVLLVGSALMARSFSRLRLVNPGFEPSHALTFRSALPTASYPTTGDAARFYLRALDAIGAIPGVQVAGIASKLPLDEEGRSDTAVWVEDHPVPPGGIPNVHQVTYVTPSYFHAAGIPLIAGRLFDRPDPERGLEDVVVSRAFAERYWKGESPIGKRVRMRLQGPWYTIVGVVGGVRGTALEQPPDEMVYVPLVSVAGDARWTPHDMAFVVRTTGDPARIAASVRSAIYDLDPGLPIYRVRPMTEIVSQASARTSLTLLLLGLSATIALLLGAVGIYGVISYVVSLRLREIGIRLALGAQPAEVSGMVARQGVSVAVTGIVVGLLGAAILTRFLGALLFEVAPLDPIALGGAAALLLVVALAASWLPARRAAGIDPAQVLRAE
jgi:predicted permease